MDATTLETRDVATFGLVVGRLRRLNCEGLSHDQEALWHALSVCKQEILLNINHTELPKGLIGTLVDMVAGRLLYEAKAAGLLPAEALDLSAPVKSITEGDVSVSFVGASDGAKTAEARFDAMVDRLMHPPERVLGAYRRLRW